MRMFRILPRSIKVKDYKLSKEALRRLEWMDWHFSHGQNARLVCRHFGISPDTFYRWKKRFSKYNLQTLEFDQQKRRPHHLRQMSTDPQILQKIYQIRLADLSMSKYKIKEALRRSGVNVSESVIQKVINRHLELKNPIKQHRVRKQRYKITRVRASLELKEKALGSLVQVDTKHVYILGLKYYIFAAIDCKSRLAFTYCYTTISSKSAKDFLLRLINYFPFRIEAINTDNGSEYLLNFHALIEELAIPHYFSYPHTPKMNARVERLIQTLEYEFLIYQDLLPEIDYLRALCNQFNQKYNQQRFHQSLNYLTPLEYVTKYQEKQKGEVYGI